jgi:hypothetical protein
MQSPPGHQILNKRELANVESRSMTRFKKLMSRVFVADGVDHGRFQ